MSPDFVKMRLALGGMIGFCFSEEALSKCLEAGAGADRAVKRGRGLDIVIKNIRRRVHEDF